MAVEIQAFHLVGFTVDKSRRSPFLTCTQVRLFAAGICCFRQLETFSLADEHANQVIIFP